MASSMIIANGLAIICQPSQNCYEVLLRLFSIMFSRVIAASHPVKRVMLNAI